MLRDEDVEGFWRDGVVCLRGVVPADWTARLAVAVEEVIAASDGTDLSAMASQIDRGGGAVLRDAQAADAPRGRFFAGTDHWRRHATFRAFALESPLPRVVAALLPDLRPLFHRRTESPLDRRPNSLLPTVPRVARHQVRRLRTDHLVGRGHFG